MVRSDNCKIINETCGPLNLSAKRVHFRGSSSECRNESAEMLKQEHRNVKTLVILSTTLIRTL